MHVMTRLTWLTLRGLVSMLAWDLGKRAGDAGVTGAAGELGIDALSADVEVVLTVPEAVRFEPAPVDAPALGLVGKGLRWVVAAERGTIGVEAVDIMAGGEAGVEGMGVLLLEWTPLGVTTES